MEDVVVRVIPPQMFGDNPYLDRALLRTPDITSIMQQIVQSPTWQNGHVVTIMIGLHRSAAVNRSMEKAVQWLDSVAEPRLNAPRLMYSGDFTSTSPLDFQHPTENLSCVRGCTDVQAFNFNPRANWEDQSCEAVVYGCTNQSSFNTNELANVDDGSCVENITGCMAERADNYNPTAVWDDGSCTITACLDSEDDCHEEAVCRYVSPTEHSCECIYPYVGVGDAPGQILSFHLDTWVSGCVLSIPGCTDPEALN
eukprot:SAG11_NODE_1190_length_5572_cov_5.594555_1_plen_253_part_10